MLKIIHVSDFHLQKEQLHHNKFNLVQKFLDDLEKNHFVDDETLIFFTGDMIDKGDSQFGQAHKGAKAFEQFELHFIAPIIDRFKRFTQLKKRIYVVPGNHDLIRTYESNLIVNGLRSELNDRGKVDLFYSENQHNYHYKHLDAYDQWATTFYKDHDYAVADYNLFHNTFVVPVAGKEVGISCLNSSWLCTDSEKDHGHLLVGKEQLSASYYKIKKCDIKVALSHHPLQFLKEFEKDDIEQFLQYNYQFFFCGHVHKLNVSSNHGVTVDDNTIIMATAHSSMGKYISDRNYTDGYAVYEIDFEANHVTGNYRRLNDTGLNFSGVSEIGDGTGIKIFKRLFPNAENESFTRPFKKRMHELIEFQRDYSLPQKLNKKVPLGFLQDIVRKIATYYDRKDNPCRIAVAIPTNEGRFTIPINHGFENPRKDRIQSNAIWDNGETGSFFAEGILEVPESKGRISDKNSKYYKRHRADKDDKESEYSLIIPFKVDSYDGIRRRELNRKNCLAVMTIGVGHRSILWNGQMEDDGVKDYAMYLSQIEQYLKFMEIALLQYRFVRNGGR